MKDGENKSLSMMPIDTKKRFLALVDGNSMDLLSIGMLLQKLDYNIYTCHNAEEAFQIIAVALPSLIITELKLPGMNGLDFLRKVKQDPHLKAIPVIILTSMNKADLEKMCRDAGCAAYFRKPFEPDELYREIQKATETAPRKYIRLETCLTMVLGEGSEKESLSAECITAISENGMYVSTVKPQPVGAAIPVTMIVNNEKIRIEGMVLYSFTAGHGPLKQPGMGIKFLRISPEGKALLQRYIKEQLMKDIPSTDSG